jgi:hypothetical protein
MGAERCLEQQEERWETGNSAKELEERVDSQGHCISTDGLGSTKRNGYGAEFLTASRFQNGLSLSETGQTHSSPWV